MYSETLSEKAMGNKSVPYVGAIMALYSSRRLECRCSLYVWNNILSKTPGDRKWHQGTSEENFI